MKFNGAYRHDRKILGSTDLSNAEKDYQKMILRQQYENGLVAGGCIVMAAMSLLVIFIVAGVR